MEINQQLRRGEGGNWKLPAASRKDPAGLRWGHKTSCHPCLGVDLPLEREK